MKTSSPNAFIGDIGPFPQGQSQIKSKILLFVGEKVGTVSQYGEKPFARWIEVVGCSRSCRWAYPCPSPVGASLSARPAKGMRDEVFRFHTGPWAGVSHFASLTVPPRGRAYGPLGKSGPMPSAPTEELTLDMKNHVQSQRGV